MTPRSKDYIIPAIVLFLFLAVMARVTGAHTAVSVLLIAPERTDKICGLIWCLQHQTSPNQPNLFGGQNG